MSLVLVTKPHNLILKIAAKEKIFSEYIFILISLHKELEYCIFIYIYCAFILFNHMNCHLSV